MEERIKCFDIKEGGPLTSELREELFKSAKKAVAEGQRHRKFGDNKTVTITSLSELTFEKEEGVIFTAVVDTPESGIEVHYFVRKGDLDEEKNHKAPKKSIESAWEKHHEEIILSARARILL